MRSGATAAESASVPESPCGCACNSASSFAFRSNRRAGSCTTSGSPSADSTGRQCHLLRRPLCSLRLQLAGNEHCTRHCSLNRFNRPAQRTAKRHASPPAAPPGRGFYSDRCTIRLSYRPQPKKRDARKETTPAPSNRGLRAAYCSLITGNNTRSRCCRNG